MQKTRSGVRRQDVIESYAKYDYRKRHPALPLPNFEAWDWFSADAIDAEMFKSSLKKGVPAGFELWDEVSLSLDDLRQCAIHNVINEKLGTNMRMLGDLDAAAFSKNGSHHPKEPGIPASQVEISLKTPGQCFSVAL